MNLVNCGTTNRFVLALSHLKDSSVFVSLNVTLFGLQVAKLTGDKLLRSSSSVPNRLDASFVEFFNVIAENRTTGSSERLYAKNK